MEDLHLVLIPDGNRRWARERGKKRLEGHMAGAEKLVETLEWTEDYPEIGKVTAWGLSRDNYDKRSEEEINDLNRVYERFLGRMADEGSTVHEYQIDVEYIGDLSVLQEGPRSELERLVESTEGYSGKELNIAVGYDYRDELAGYELEEDKDELREQIREGSDLEKIDVFLRYGEGSPHLSGFAPMALLEDATLHFPGKNWPEAEESDIEEALEGHEDREHTRGA